jgi:hypothetical protein
MTGSARKRAFVLALLGTAIFAPPTYAVEADTGSPMGPELPAPRADRRGFDLDNQADAVIEPEDDAIIVERGNVPDWLVEPKPERDLPNPDMEDLSPTR